jgi:hypothetical protein
VFYKDYVNVVGLIETSNANFNYNDIQVASIHFSCDTIVSVTASNFTWSNITFTCQIGADNFSDNSSVHVLGKFPLLY